MQVQTVWKAGSERHDWRLFLLQTCLTMAILLLGGAIICWVAANWAAWSRFERLTGMQVVLAIVALGAMILLWRNRAQATQARSASAGLLGLACVALGALLALVGQTYQTGADTWELFAVWGALMLPWAIAGRSASIWLLWVAIVNTALILWGGPDTVRDQWSRLSQAPLWMLPFNLAALGVWTACTTGTQTSRRSGPRLLAAVALLTATVAFMNDTRLLGIGALLWAWTAVPLGLTYHRARPDGAILAMLVLSILAVSLRLVWVPFEGDEWELRVVLTITLSLIAGVLGHRWIRQALQGDAAGIEPTTRARALGFAFVIAALACAVLAWAAMKVDFTASNTLIGAGVIALLGLALWIYLTIRALARTPSVPYAAANVPNMKTPAAPPLAAPAHAGHAPDSSDASNASNASSMASAVLLAVTAWFAAALFVGLIAIIGIWDAETTLPFGGPLFTLAGVVMVRVGARSLFARQVASALAFAGLLLLTVDAFIFDQPTWTDAMRLVVYSLAVYVLSGYATMQFLAALVLAVGLTLLTWLVPASGVDIFQAVDAIFDGPGAHALGAWTPVSFGLAALAIVLFLNSHRSGSGKWRFDPLPMAWAMALAALTTAWVSAGVPLTQLGILWALHAPTALLLVAGACLPAAASVGAMWPLRHVLPARMRWGVPAGLMALGILWLPSPGILFALTWTLLGFGLRRRSLLALGSISLIAYLCAYYYQLGVPLLDKALWLGLAGLVAAVLGVVLLRAHKHATGLTAPGAYLRDAHDSVGPETTQGLNTASEPTRAPARAAWRPALACAGLLLILGLVNMTILQREQLIANGRQVLLELAPVDPRSLMQGDYMRLEFVLARDIRERIDTSPEIAPPGDGYAILSLLPTGEARLERLQATPETATEKETALHYRVRDGEVRVVTNAWFFPEGQAEHFEKSRYGVLRVDATGRALLTEMRDVDFKPL